MRRARRGGGWGNEFRDGNEWGGAQDDWVRTMGRENGEGASRGGLEDWSTGKAEGHRPHAPRDYREAGVKVTFEVFHDRVVVTSPGLPPGGQSLTRIASGHGRSRSRNPLLS